MKKPSEAQVRAGIDRFVKRVKESGGDPRKAREKAKQLAQLRAKKLERQR
jgi:hypothetical protein